MPYIFSKITLLSVLLCWPPEHTTDSAAVKLCHGPLIPSLYITTVSLFFSVGAECNCFSPPCFWRVALCVALVRFCFVLFWWVRVCVCVCVCVYTCAYILYCCFKQRFSRKVLVMTPTDHKLHIFSRQRSRTQHVIKTREVRESAQ